MAGNGTLPRRSAARRHSHDHFLSALLSATSAPPRFSCSSTHPPIRRISLIRGIRQIRGALFWVINPPRPPLRPLRLRVSLFCGKNKKRHQKSGVPIPERIDDRQVVEDEAVLEVFRVKEDVGVEERVLSHGDREVPHGLKDPRDPSGRDLASSPRCADPP